MFSRTGPHINFAHPHFYTVVLVIHEDAGDLQHLCGQSLQKFPRQTDKNLVFGFEFGLKCEYIYYAYLYMINIYLEIVYRFCLNCVM